MKEVLARVKENVTFVYSPEDKEKLDKSYMRENGVLKRKDEEKGTEDKS